MTDLAKAAARQARRATPRSARRRWCRDGTAADGTRKWLLDVGSGNAVEAVFIPEDDRGTLCVSSQAGCALDCAFCSTGKQGFNRNLDRRRDRRPALAREPRAARRRRHRALGRGRPRADQQRRDDGHGRAAGQFRRRRRRAAPDPRRQRLRPVAPPRHAVDLRHRARASTGCATRARWRWRCRCTRPTTRCATGWCRSTASTRCAELLAACRRYLERAPRDFVTFEYVMLDGVNDSRRTRASSPTLVRDVPCKFNLIPFNPFPGAGFRDEPARARSSRSSRRCMRRRLS